MAMKLLRYGQVGSEKPGTLDAEEIIHDLSSILGDIAGTSLLPELWRNS
jgi:ureidoglycolate lyase/2,4-diketo-3-deoxy-L-fuconate hydrolase